MSKIVSTKELLKQVRVSDFVRNCPIPMGYTAGYPLLSMQNGVICMTIPYVRYQITGQVDKTLVYPIRCAVTVTVPGGMPVGFQDLRVDRRFQKVSFDKPVGLFRHEAIRGLTKQEFAQKRDELYECYDQVLCAMLQGQAYSQQEGEKLSQLLKTLVEPSLMPVYKALEPAFYEKFMA